MGPKAPNPSRFKLAGTAVLNGIGAVVLVYLLVVLTQTVKHNYDMNRQIADLKAQIALLQDQKEQLAYTVQYYNTDSFREREARSKLGLQQPGENVVIIPRAKTVPAPAPTAPTSTTRAKSNFQQWLDFLNGRPS